MKKTKGFSHSFSLTEDNEISLNGIVISSRQAVGFLEAQRIQCKLLEEKIKREAAWETLNMNENGGI